MVDVRISEDALGRLRAAKAAMDQQQEMQEINAARDEVVARYGPVFQPGAVENLDEQVLRSFLLIENNRHWSGLFRQGNRICADMAKTRAALSELVDETRPIQERTKAATDIKGMGKGIITAILLVAYPDKYGVWNNTSNSGLAELGLLPEWPRGASFGVRYAAINEVLVSLARQLNVDLWVLDTIWWHLMPKDNGLVPLKEQEPYTRQYAPARYADSSFILERHLHDYMYQNWSQLPLAEEWDLYTRDGEPDAGYEYSTSVGQIDLLAQHKHEPRWLVIELKRGKTSDATIGQVLRYMGWVQEKLSEIPNAVEGLIVATEADDKLRYALSMVPGVSLKTYEFDFRLKD